MAQTCTWQGDGGTDTNWGTANNWHGSVTDHAKPTTGDSVVFSNAVNCAVNEATANLKSFDMTGYTGTLSGASAITVVGAATSTDVVKFAGTITWTGTLNLNATSATSCVIQLTTNTKTLNNIAIAGTAGGSVALQDNLTFNAAKTYTLTLSNNNLNMGANTISGNSGINRILVASNTLGTARTVTISGAGTFANADFRDITLSAATDLSAITGGSGDCGGNTGITFTTADDWYWHVGSGSWSNYAKWYTATNGGGSQMASTLVPLPQDSCYFDSNSFDSGGTITADMPRWGKNIDFTGATGTPAVDQSTDFTVYGSLTYISGMAIYNVKAHTFEGRGSHLLTSGIGINRTKNFNSIGGVYQLGANLPSSEEWITLNNGTFDANDYNLSIQRFSTSGTSARTLLMGNGDWHITQIYSGGAWNLSTTTNLSNPTTLGEGSTLYLDSTSSTAQTFDGGGCVYNNLSIAGGGSVVWTFTGTNTFSTFTINAPKTVKFTAGTTTTVSSLVATGDAGNLIHIDSTSASAATLSDTTGTNTVHYCHIGETGNVNASGGATWDASDNCEVNTSTGWTTAGVGGFMTCSKFWGA